MEILPVEADRHGGLIMIISFDLDGVLFLTPYDGEDMLEPELKFPWKRIYRKDRLRRGTPELIHALQDRGFEVWVYTSSARRRSYIEGLFRHYGIQFSDIVNAQRHEREVQHGRTERYPNKMPGRYRISLHIDDEKNVVEYGRLYGFNVFLLKNDNRNWIQDIIAKAEQIRAREETQNEIHRN